MTQVIKEAQIQCRTQYQSQTILYINRQPQSAYKQRTTENQLLTRHSLQKRSTETPHFSANNQQHLVTQTIQHSSIESNDNVVKCFHPYHHLLSLHHPLCTITPQRHINNIPSTKHNQPQQKHRGQPSFKFSYILYYMIIMIN